MLKIVTAPNLILSHPTKPVTSFDDELKKIIDRMTKTLLVQTNPKGVGLAANQVDIDLSIFLIKPTESSPVETFINPKILDHQSTALNKPRKTKKKRRELEGCLSIPTIWGPVKRHGKVLLEYCSIDGTVKKEWFSGFKSVIIQHEMDHLNGVLFTQQVMEQRGRLYKEENGELHEVKI